MLLRSHNISRLWFYFRCNRDGKKQGKGNSERSCLWTSQIAPQMPYLQTAAIHYPTAKGAPQETLAKMTLQEITRQPMCSDFRLKQRPRNVKGHVRILLIVLRNVKGKMEPANSSMITLSKLRQKFNKVTSEMKGACSSVTTLPCWSVCKWKRGSSVLFGWTDLFYFRSWGAKPRCGFQ